MSHVIEFYVRSKERKENFVLSREEGRKKSKKGKSEVSKHSGTRKSAKKKHRFLCGSFDATFHVPLSS